MTLLSSTRLRGLRVCPDDGHDYRTTDQLLREFLSREHSVRVEHAMEGVTLHDSDYRFTSVGQEMQVGVAVDNRAGYINLKVVSPKQLTVQLLLPQGSATGDTVWIGGHPHSVGPVITLGR